MRWRLRLVLAGLVSTLTELSGLALLATAVWLITRAAQQPPLIALSVAIVAVRAFAIGKGTLRYVERLVSHDAVLRVLADLRTRVFAGLARDPSGSPRGDALSRLVSDVDGVQDALLRCALPAAVGALVTVATVGFAAAFSVPAALLTASGMLVAGLLLPLAAYALTQRAARRLAPARAEHVAAALDVVYGAADLAAFGATPAALTRASAKAGALARLERSAGYRGAVVGALGALLPGATALAVLAVVTGSGAGREMVAVLPLLALAAVEVLLPLTSAATRYAELRTSLARVRPLIATSPDGAPDGEPDGVLAGPVTLTLAGVGARYRDERAAALSGVDLELPAGRRVAVVGPSGSGKSTLLGVLSGALTPDSGSMAVVGADPDPAHRWRVAGGVLADAHVFHTTVRENLTLGRPGYSDDDLRDALLAAGLPATPAALAPAASAPGAPEDAGATGGTMDLDRVVGEEGGTLSGGERQRLLVARAVLAAPPVLLLDEPTEGLDPAAADALVARLLDGAGHRSVVLVTHRLVDLAGFDEVLVLDQGRVVQRGRHEQLVTADGWYAQWYAAAWLTEQAYVAAAAVG